MSVNISPFSLPSDRPPCISSKTRPPSPSQGVLCLSRHSKKVQTPWYYPIGPPLPFCLSLLTSMVQPLYDRRPIPNHPAPPQRLDHPQLILRTDSHPRAGLDRPQSSDRPCAAGQPEVDREEQHVNYSTHTCTQMKTHLLLHTRALCGRAGRSLTLLVHQVTCRQCLRLLTTRLKRRLTSGGSK